MAQVTPQSRVYAWGSQTDYQTTKTLAANALRKILASDKNFFDHTPKTTDNEDWAHGKNFATEQWLEAHDTKVSHTLPGYIEELGTIFKAAMGTVVTTTPSGATNARKHIFSPQDADTSRQLPAYTYAEKVGAHNILMPSSVCDGFTLKGNDLGVLMADFGLQGSGAIVNPSGVNWATHVVSPANLHKLFNTQIALNVTDGTTPVTYGCKYRSFELAYKNELMLEAGYKPGCARFQTANDPTSGVIRSELIFNKQSADFKFEVDLEVDSGELDAVVTQKKMTITLTATADIIESTTARKMTITIPLAYYKARKIGESNNVMRFSIEGKVFFDYTTGKFLEIELINDVTGYASW